MNNDIYAEWLVKKKKSPLVIPFYIGTALLVFISLLLSIVFAWGFIALILVCVLAYIGNMRLHVEYEYLFVTNELSIDRILSQRSRKTVRKIEMSKAEKVAPMSSHEFDYAKNNPQVKIVDYSSGNQDAITYGISYSDGSGKFVFVIEPNERLLKCMKNSAPRKVIIEKSLSGSNS